MGVFAWLRRLDARFVPAARALYAEPDYSSYWRWYRGQRMLMGLTGSCTGLLGAGIIITVTEWSTGGGLEPFITTPVVGAAMLAVAVVVGWVRYRRERPARVANLDESS